MTSLSNKYRPSTWSEIVGQEHVTTTLQNAIRRDLVQHAYLFSGPRGTGKTTTARVFTRALGDDLLHDLIEIDAASHGGVKDVRTLRERAHYRPSDAQYRVYLLDEAHMLSKAAFNALLKIMEEPPEHTIFILCTTEPHKLPDTVISRCQWHAFHRLAPETITHRLRYIADQENISITDDALTVLSTSVRGGMRDAEMLLSQLASHAPVTVHTVHTVLGIGVSDSARSIASSVVRCNRASALKHIVAAVDSGIHLPHLTAQIVSTLDATLLSILGIGTRVPTVPADSEDLPIVIQALRAFSSVSDTDSHIELELSALEAMERPSHRSLSLARYMLSAITPADTALGFSVMGDPVLRAAVLDLGAIPHQA